MGGGVDGGKGIHINYMNSIHIFHEHPPVLCLDCLPGWTVVVVVCMQTGVLLSHGHCCEVRQLETSRLPM